jgi:hypothetical protein
MATKDEVLAYVRKTPANTNVNVLGTMLDGVGGSSEKDIKVCRIDYGDNNFLEGSDFTSPEELFAYCKEHEETHDNTIKIKTTSLVMRLGTQDYGFGDGWWSSRSSYYTWEQSGEAVTLYSDRINGLSRD